MLDILFISIGSIVGANLRMFITNLFESRNYKNIYSILLINITSCFLLGCFVANERQEISFFRSNKHLLFFNIGILGSFSTFSAFALEVFEKIRIKKINHAFWMASISIITGLIACLLGYKIGN